MADAARKAYLQRIKVCVILKEYVASKGFQKKRPEFL